MILQVTPCPHRRIPFQVIQFPESLGKEGVLQVWDKILGRKLRKEKLLGFDEYHKPQAPGTLTQQCYYLGGGFKYVLCSPLLGEDSHFV